MRKFFRRLQKGKAHNIRPSDHRFLVEEASHVEAIALRILSEHQAISIVDLVTLVGVEAMIEEQRQGAWVSDIGFWGPSYYYDLASETVRGMIGHSLALQFEGGCIAIPIA